MLGPLPRLHRWVLLAVGVLTGVGLGAWVSHWAKGDAAYSCSDVMAGLCVVPTVNLVPVLLGAAVGLFAAVWLLHRPDERPHRLPVDDDRA